MKSLGYYKELLQRLPKTQKELLVRKLQRDIFSENLLAYIVTKENETLDITQLKQFLSEKLPDYMIPSDFIEMDALPLTENAKIDIKALPFPEPKVVYSYVAPRNNVEMELAEIWQPLLMKTDISIYDNFFQLGGHSLLATQVISRIRQHFKKHLPISAIFENPTIESLSILISKTAIDEKDHVHIPRLLNNKDLYLSYQQEQFWIISQLDLESSLYNMPGALEILGDINIVALEQSINTILKRHENLRATFYMDDNGQPLQCIAEQLTVSLFPVENIDETNISNQFLTEAKKSFDLSQGPLIRFKLLQCSFNKYFLIVIMHHIVADGWSMKIFIKELLALYPSFCEGKSKALPCLSIQYKDYANWQRHLIEKGHWAASLDYWKIQLANAPKVFSSLPDKPRGAKQSFNGAIIDHHYSALLKKNITAFCQKENVTFFMMMVMAYQLLLKFHSGQNDILIGTPVANRNVVETEDLIGCFINTIVLRNQFSNQQTLRQVLSQVKTTVLQGYHHQDVPLEKILEVLQVERHREFSPLFQVMLVLQNADEGVDEISFPNLKMKPLEISIGLAKFDLTLSITETETGFIGRYEYNTDLFYEETIRAMANNFSELLEDMMQNLEHTIGNLSLFSKVNNFQISNQTHYIAGEL